MTILFLSYNQEEYVASALESILCQQCEPLEIIASDDCSTDKTFDIIRERLENYDGPHCIKINRNSANIGFTQHFNKAMTKVSGEIVIYAAGDDVSHPERTKRIIEIFDSSEASLIFSYVNSVNKNGEVTRQTRLNTSPIFFHSFDIGLAWRSFSLYVGATTAFRYELWREFGKIDFDPAYEDQILGFRSLFAGGAKLLAEPLVDYRSDIGLTALTREDLSRKGYQQKLVHRQKNRIAVLKQRRQDILLAQKWIALVPKIDRRLLAERGHLLLLTGKKRKLIALYHRYPAALTIAIWYSIRAKAGRLWWLLML